jgi:MFS family permease
MASSMTGSLSVYATSSFQQHSSGLSALSVATSIIGSTALPFLSKLSDVFGRPHIYLICMILQVVGYIISLKSPTLAACKYHNQQSYFSFHRSLTSSFASRRYHRKRLLSNWFERFRFVEHDSHGRFGPSQVSWSRDGSPLIALPRYRL